MATVRCKCIPLEVAGVIVEYIQSMPTGPNSLAHGLKVLRMVSAAAEGDITFDDPPAPVPSAAPVNGAEQALAALREQRIGRAKGDRKPKG